MRLHHTQKLQHSKGDNKQGKDNMKCEKIFTNYAPGRRLKSRIHKEHSSIGKTN
jgi:hypothetical protein